MSFCARTQGLLQAALPWCAAQNRYNPYTTHAPYDMMMSQLSIDNDDSTALCTIECTLLCGLYPPLRDAH